MLKESVRLHMRTINEAAEHFKEVDPHTALTKTAVRRLVSTGVVPSVRIGNKALVSLEALNEYLSGAQSQQEARPATGVIRRVGDVV